MHTDTQRDIDRETDTPSNFNLDRLIQRIKRASWLTSLIKRKFLSLTDRPSVKERGGRAIKERF